MMFSLTFYQILNTDQLNNTSTDNKKENKEFLSDAIINHQIWKENEYWAAMILYTIREEYTSKKKYTVEMKESPEESLERVRNIFYGHLASAARNMVIFGQDKNEVKNMIMRYCKLASLSDKQIKDIVV